MKSSKKDRLLKMKLNVLKSQVKGKKVIIIDDSIFLGNTSSHIVNLLREAGADQVHMRISSPPMKHNCYYGSDLCEEKEMISNLMSVDELKNYIGADSLEFLDPDVMKDIVTKDGVGVCDACFTGNYNAPVPKENFVDKFSRKISLKK